MKKFIKYGMIVIVGVAVLLAAFCFLFPKAAFRLAIDAQRRSADLVKKEVLVDNHRIVYLEGGTGETIVLLHGFGGYKDQWTAFARYMKGYRSTTCERTFLGTNVTRPGRDCRLCCRPALW